MKRLSEEEVHKYIIPRNKNTGVKAITEEMLKAIDLDEVPLITREGELIRTNKGLIFIRSDYSPEAGTYAFKPSFAGDQVLIGKYADGKLQFSNGVWFIHSR